jgi:hypothetical protein
MIWLLNKRNFIQRKVECFNFNGKDLFELKKEEICSKSTIFPSTETKSIKNTTHLSSTKTTISFK